MNYTVGEVDAKEISSDSFTYVSFCQFNLSWIHNKNRVLALDLNLNKQIRINILKHVVINVKVYF